MEYINDGFAYYIGEDDLFLSNGEKYKILESFYTLDGVQILKVCAINNYTVNLEAKMFLSIADYRTSIINSIII